MVREKCYWRNYKNRYFFEARYPVFGAMFSRGTRRLYVEVKSGGFCIFDADYREMKIFWKKLLRNCKDKYFFEARYPVFDAGTKRFRID